MAHVNCILVMRNDRDDLVAIGMTGA